MLNTNKHHLLTPLFFIISLFYRLVVSLRNKFFDWQWLKSVKFDFPVISVGNITVGGTGKTPHVEYLLGLLSNDFEVAMLSRGYKRKTRGYVLAGKNATPDEIGDEPWQIHNKFKKALVAVDEKRVRGIEKLKEKNKEIEVVILDDAFQHRYVKPGLSILLVDYYRPLSKDYILPYGSLREPESSVHRAHIVIVTKVPKSITPIERRIWIKDLNLYPYQFLYFTRFEYGELKPLFGKQTHTFGLNKIKELEASIILVTGIANPKPLINHLESLTEHIEIMLFPDHHNFTLQNIDEIVEKFERLNSKLKWIITTEKDAVKLSRFSEIDNELKKHFYFIPVEIKFIDDKKEEFDKNIVSYVKKNKRVSRLHR